MNKRFLLPVLSTALLAPAFLAGQVYAEEAAAPAESPAVVANPATSETPAAPTTEAATPTSAESAEAKETPVESTKNEEKDTVILHTNDVHGRIVEEKGVIGDAKLATVIEQERAKSNQTTLVVDAGDAAFSPRLAGFVLDAFGAGAGEVAVADTELDRLSAREREVMRLIARGYTYKECASELFISVKTVETHVSAVLRKLQLSNRNELTRWAVARRIV